MKIESSLIPETLIKNLGRIYYVWQKEWFDSEFILESRNNGLMERIEERMKDNQKKEKAIFKSEGAELQFVLEVASLNVLKKCLESEKSGQNQLPCLEFPDEPIGMKKMIEILNEWLSLSKSANTGGN